MIIKLSPKIKKDVIEILKEYGYESQRDFIEEALRRRILELKKSDFLMKIKEIKKRMREKKITEERILKDFDKFYHKR